jgi:hypothetical protein
MDHRQHLHLHCLRILWYAQNMSKSGDKAINDINSGAFWLAFAATLTPYYNAEGAFVSHATTPEETAAGIATFQDSLGTCSC